LKRHAPPIRKKGLALLGEKKTAWPCWLRKKKREGRFAAPLKGGAYSGERQGIASRMCGKKQTTKRGGRRKESAPLRPQKKKKRMVM